MCKCIERIENNIKELFLKENPQGKEITSVTLVGKAFMFDSGKTELSIPVHVYYKKNDRGFRKDYNMTTSYCPFCGDEIIKEKNK